MAVVLSDLLKGKPPEAFSASELTRKAHYRWDRGEEAAAALLFEAAQARAEAEGDRAAAMAARNRAAITFARSTDDRAAARARLDAVIADYERGPAEILDAHFAEWAATELLVLDQADGPSDFTPAFRALQARCARAGCPRYPAIFPQQERLAELAFAGGARGVMADVLPRLRARKTTRALNARLDQWAAWLKA
ncbi:MAG: hypothetical protein R3F60_33290 [bacterium]